MTQPLLISEAQLSVSNESLRASQNQYRYQNSKLRLIEHTVCSQSSEIDSLKKQLAKLKAESSNEIRRRKQAESNLDKVNQACEQKCKVLHNAKARLWRTVTATASMAVSNVPRRSRSISNLKHSTPVDSTNHRHHLGLRRLRSWHNGPRPKTDDLTSSKPPSLINSECQTDMNTTDSLVQTDDIEYSSSTIPSTMDKSVSVQFEDVDELKAKLKSCLSRNSKEAKK